MIDLWQEIYGTLRRNKLRTFLTGFAVAWGIFMLIVLLGAGNGLIHAFEQNSSERALNSIRIFPGWTTQSYDGLKEGRRIELDNRDLTDTETQFPDNVTSVGATVRQSGLNISFGKEYVNLSLLGVHPNYTEIEAVKTAEGRFINDIDLKERRKVIVLHQKSADILFGKTHTEPIGQFVNAGGVAYQVVGIYNDQGNSEPSEAYIPFSTLQTIYNKGNKLNNILLTTDGLTSLESNEAFEAEYRRVIGANHRFSPDDTGAIWIWNRFTDYLRTMNAMGILRTAIWVIGIFVEHHAHHRARAHPRVRHPQGTGRQAGFHPVAHHRGECRHHHPLRLHRHGGGHRRDGVDGQHLRQPDDGCQHVPGQDVQRPDGRPSHRHTGYSDAHRSRHAGRFFPCPQGHENQAHRGIEGGLMDN